ncbi:ABC-type dipeptide/oligopeptide/nickel transport system permease subunit [Kibdelosporangium banguiense]|uniref:ABC-type dipeptide/oligopeptide/nickel transport system permease subunit n=1 Tax=Kibdelosporangium banguiense TaxID=1365924 RepID=A0ABS4TCD1_9PSEU|nr:ABC transporter permease [Kibdelosporangium banguiense]MBP2321518.1 ABC-type dipeptide/oligopeptide/nickel transport system permease subunit [Kibdelosporangium banguiense]
MTAPIEVSGQSAEAQPEAALTGLSQKAIQGRSLGQIAWMRLKRDKVAMASGVLVVIFVLAALAAFLLDRVFGVINPLAFNEDLLDASTQMPITGWGGISWDHPMGIEPGYYHGRDILTRIFAGSWISLLIGFAATMISVIIGAVLGVIAGYFRGWVDTVISRAMDMFLAFPLLLFAIALAGVIPDDAFGLTGDWPRILVLVFVIGFFNWPYIGRIVRAQTLSLREREFVDAARSLGGRSPYILFKELLPNLMAPLLVYSTLLIPTNILFEAALSFLGVGVRPPTPTWGGMLSDATSLYSVDPWFMIFPGLAIFVTVLAFNLLGDGLRDALDPRAR